MHQIIICRKKGGEELKPSNHLSTFTDSESTQLIIHDATVKDIGTYTATVTRPDGTQVSI